MENPPSYHDVCRTDRDGRPQQVTLTLVLPQPQDDDAQNDRRTEGQEESRTTVEPPPYDAPPYDAPSEPPPKYSDIQDDKKPQDSGLITDENARDNTGLGADMVFTLAFIIAFIFNWIGFIFAYCLSMTMAGRYGALSGFGASMVKWSIIAMNSTCCTDYLKNAACLLVALIACGFVIFLRGIYLHVKTKNQMQRGEGGAQQVQIVYHRM